MRKILNRGSSFSLAKCFQFHFQKKKKIEIIFPNVFVQSTPGQYDNRSEDV